MLWILLKQVKKEKGKNEIKSRKTGKIMTAKLQVQHSIFSTLATWTLMSEKI